MLNISNSPCVYKQCQDLQPTSKSKPSIRRQSTCSGDLPPKRTVTGSSEDITYTFKKPNLRYPSFSIRFVC